MFDKIKKYFKRNKGNPRIFTEEEHQRALEMRNQKAEIRRLEQQVMMKEQLEILRNISSGNTKGKGGIEEKFMEMVLPMVLAKMTNNPQNSISQQQPLNISNGIHTMDTDKINDIVSKVKPYITPQIKKILTELTESEIIEIKKEITK